MHRRNWPRTYRTWLPALMLAGLMAGCESVFPVSGSSDSQSQNEASSQLQNEASQIISQCLSNPEPMLRSNAAEVVGTTRLAPLMPGVVRLFSDPLVPVRFQALIAAGDMKYTLAARNIQQIYMNPQEDTNVRMAAAYALVKMGSPKLADFYRQLIKHPNSTIRANAALLIGKTGQRSALPLLEWAINSVQSDERVRLQALESMAMLQSPSAYEKIWTRLISAFADDRIMGIQAMAHLQNQQAVGALVTMLDDDVPEVRLAAAEKLGKLGSLRGEPVVRKVLEKPISGDVATQMRTKIMAALAVGEIKSESLAKYLPKFLNDPSKYVQLAAAKAIFRQGMP